MPPSELPSMFLSMPPSMFLSMAPAMPLSMALWLGSAILSSEAFQDWAILLAETTLAKLPLASQAARVLAGL